MVPGAETEVPLPARAGCAGTQFGPLAETVALGQKRDAPACVGTHARCAERRRRRTRIQRFPACVFRPSAPLQIRIIIHCSWGALDIRFCMICRG